MRGAFALEAAEPVAALGVALGDLPGAAVEVPAPLEPVWAAPVAALGWGSC